MWISELWCSLLHRDQFLYSYRVLMIQGKERKKEKKQTKSLTKSNLTSPHVCFQLACPPPPCLGLLLWHKEIGTVSAGTHVWAHFDLLQMGRRGMDQSVVSPSVDTTQLRQMATHLEPRSARGFYLLEGSFSLPLLASAAHGGNCWVAVSNIFKTMVETYSIWKFSRDNLIWCCINEIDLTWH